MKDAELRVLEGAEEFSLGRGPAGVLLVHGFTGSPQSMRPLGRHLADGGFGVLGVRLPGHGTTWQDLNTRTASEWVGAVEAGVALLEDAHDRVFLVGLSFGAAISLDIAGRWPDRVAGVVALAPFVSTPDPRRVFAPVVKLVTTSMPGVGNDICDPGGREICYDRLPTTAAHAMLRYLKMVRSHLSDVRAPLLVIHSRNDHTAHPSNAELVLNGVSSDDKELVWLDRSYHVITLDYDREGVNERTLAFIRERATGES